ncbi:MAG: 4Fe-4S binding protein [Desulfobacteraceae bacterium]|nr:4Fe-4S binding protein [Desulfobacteraceae bacterium]
MDPINHLHRRLATINCKATIIPVSRAAEIRDEIFRRNVTGDIHPDLYRLWLTPLFEAAEKKLNGAKSLIVTAAPQYPLSVEFRVQDKTFTTRVPPTYTHGTDYLIHYLITDVLTGYGLTARKAVLPLKLTAVRSGLAAYGRNNVTYVFGMGSFFRLAAFYSDLEPPEDAPWEEAQAMETCDRCLSCVQACPTGAIDDKRFLIRAEKCLTFFNEREQGFPDWIDPSWHNCLVGCLRCQLVCPMNKRHEKSIQFSVAFTEPETERILSNRMSDLPVPMQTKLDQLGLTDYLPVLARNLETLMVKAG